LRQKVGKRPDGDSLLGCRFGSGVDEVRQRDTIVVVERLQGPEIIGADATGPFDLDRVQAPFAIRADGDGLQLLGNAPHGSARSSGIAFGIDRMR